MSFGELSAAVNSPTGTVDASTAPEIARAYESAEGVPTNGSRDEPRPIASQSDFDQTCPYGGNINGSSSGQNAASISYNGCCFLEGCCVDGSANIAYDSSGTGAFCADYDITESCEGELLNLDFAFCFDANSLVFDYLVEVDGQTFVANGSLIDGDGTLTVTGENGTWTCEYTDYSGTCTSSSGENFSF